MTHGILYIISAPSGTGKSTLIQKLTQNNSLLQNIKHSISYTTRTMRSKEINGKHYYFITRNKFEDMINKNSFFEYTHRFGHYYGTSRIKIEKMLRLKYNIILDLDWEGVKQIKKKTLKHVLYFCYLPHKKNSKNVYINVLKIPKKI